VKVEKELESAIICDSSCRSSIIACIVKSAYIIPHKENLRRLNFSAIIGELFKSAKHLRQYNKIREFCSRVTLKISTFAESLLKHVLLLSNKAGGSLKITGSRPNEVNEFFFRKIIFLGSRARQVRRTDNLTAICEPIV
jgi:hypothetical protein